MQDFDLNDDAWRCGGHMTWSPSVPALTHLDNEAEAWRATGAATRTYLWLAKQELEPPTDDNSESESDDSSTPAYPLFDAWPPSSSSAPTSPTTLSPFFAAITFKMPHALSLCDGRKSATVPAPRGILVKKSSRLRHAVSCVSLPRSPHPPHTLNQGSKLTFRTPESSSAPSPKSPSSRGMMAALHLPSRRPRGRSSSPRRPLPLNFSNSPAIIVTSSSAETPGRILFSPISPSFPSDYPSESESSYYDFFDEGFGSSTDSDSAWSRRTKNSSPARNALPSSCIRALQVFKETCAEEKSLPQLFAPKTAFKYISDFFTAREMLTIDSSEFVHRRTIMEPGMHGCVTPCAPALADHLALLAKYNPGGCHIFLSRHALNRKDFEYQYQGFYRVTQKDMRSYSEDKPKAKLVASGSDSGEESHLVFFLQFLGYDREVFNALDRFVMNEAQTLRRDTSQSQSCSRALRRAPTWQVEEPGKSMVTTVDGIDFEIMPTSVAWNHGFLKDDSWICV